MTTNDIAEEESSQKKPSLQKYTMPRFRLWLHIIQVIFTLLSVCMVAPVVGVRLAYKGSSAPGLNYTLFVIVLTFLIPICLAFFPWIYSTKNRLKPCGKFFMKPRTNVIFTAFCFILWATGGIAITTYAFDPSTCTQESDNSAWDAQCNCAKVAVVFVWVTCLVWLLTLLLAVFVFWKQKQLGRQVKQEREDPTSQPVDHAPVDHAPVDHPPVSEAYYPPPLTSTSPYPPLTSTSPYPPLTSTYPPLANTSPPPLGPIQYPYYPEPPYQPQPSMPLAAMPDPQHYRQQHRVV